MSADERPQDTDRGPDVLDAIEDAPNEAPRQAGPWLRRLSGLAFLVLGLVCAPSAAISAAAVSLASKPWAQVVLTAVSVWLGATCVHFASRLPRNKPRPDGGLMSPAALRLAAVFFIGLPIASRARSVEKQLSVVRGADPPGTGVFLNRRVVLAAGAR